MFVVWVLGISVYDIVSKGIWEFVNFFEEIDEVVYDVIDLVEVINI